jgi:hypothetical protein
LRRRAIRAVLDSRVLFGADWRSTPHFLRQGDPT